MSLLLAGVLFISGQTIAQKTFSESYNELDPAPDSLSLDEVKIVYDKYLADAISKLDTQKIFNGYLYVIDDYFNRVDYISVMSAIQETEKFLDPIDNNLWKGQLNHRKGEMYALLGNYKLAIKYFEISLSQSTQSQDYENVALSLEQLASLYGYEEQYEKSEEYFEKAFKYISVYCKPKTLAVAYSNYGNVLSYKGESEKAIEYFTKALELNKSLGSKYRENICKSNIAASSLALKDYERARTLWLECVAVNKENGWSKLLLANYSGLSDIYDLMNDSEKSLFYLKQYELLEDSLVGIDINNEIAALEINQLEANQKLEIEAKEDELNNTKRKYSKWLWIVSIGGLLLGTFLLIVYLNRKRQVYLLKKNKEKLLTLTKELEAKNSKLLSDIQNLKPNESKNQSINSLEQEVNPFNMSILTDKDWQLFKESFEKSHPNLIQNIRSQYPNISEAEERLFLLLKLKLSRREIANILGILPDTVKKTRSRLRKRLQLETGSNLDEFIDAFN